MPNRVLIDGCVFENSFQIGIWRNFYEVMTRLRSRVDYTLWLRNETAQRCPDGVRCVRDRSRRPVKRKNLLGRFLRHRAASVARRRLGPVDVFHSSFFTPSPIPGAAEVVTVHDMIMERFFASAGIWAEHIAAKRAAIASAKICIAVSAATADDLKLFFPEVAQRIRVVHHGADHLLAADDSIRRAGAEPAVEPFALFVGAREGYKNFLTLLEAMCHPAWPRGLNLHVVGPPLLAAESRLIAAQGLHDRVRPLGRLSDAELREQYAAARCFVFPSLLEGFGLPVLEAQANGCPTVLSEIAVFREIAGKGAIYFDPRLSETLAEAVAATCEPSCRRKAVEAAWDNVRRFRWERTAEQTCAAYAEAAQLAGR